MNPFDKAFEIVVGIEGGYVNDPDDPGGATRYGITEKVARAHGYAGDMKDLPIELAKDVYRSGYWGICKCDSLKWPLSLFVFDSAVNQGTDAAIRILQKTLNVQQDGLIGPGTISAANRAGPEIPSLYLADRAVRYTGTRNADKYLRGWLRRLFVMAMEA